MIQTKTQQALKQHQKKHCDRLSLPVSDSSKSYGTKQKIRRDAIRCLPRDKQLIG